MSSGGSIQMSAKAIERNQTLIAQIMPSQRTMSAAQALSGLQLPMLTPVQANAWLSDSKESFGEELRDPWA